MRTILVLAIYLPVAFFGLGLMLMMAGYKPGHDHTHSFFGVYILWVVIFGYGAGWLACASGVADWMLQS